MSFPGVGKFPESFDPVITGSEGDNIPEYHVRNPLQEGVIIPV
jgi:hypothetical protein